MSLKLKLRTPTGRKARLLSETAGEYRGMVEALLAGAYAERERYESLGVDDRRGRVVERMVTIPDGVGLGLHSSLRNSARLSVAAAIESYLGLRERAAAGFGDPPSWPGDAQQVWPDYEAVLTELSLLANDEERETALRNDLMRCSFRAKRERRGLGDVIWFGAMDGAKRARYGALLTDGNNLFLLAYLRAKGTGGRAIQGDGHLTTLTGEFWRGSSHCAAIFPLESDAHGYQEARFLGALRGGEAALKAGVLLWDRGDWYFVAQIAWQRTLLKPARWLGLAFDSDVPVLASSGGQIWSIGRNGLTAVAGLDVLLRASLQHRGRDVSYHRLYGAAADQVTHIWANAVVEIAQREGVGIAVSGAKRRLLGVPMLRLQEALGYKLALESLPMRLTSAKGAAWTCPSCGREVTKGSEWRCECGLAISVGQSVAWHLAKRAEERRSMVHEQDTGE